MAGFNFDSLLKIARGEYEQKTEGNLALVESQNDVQNETVARPVPVETGAFPFIGGRNRKTAPHPIGCRLRAFKRSCADYHISFSVCEDEQGRPRVKLTAPTHFENGRYCLSMGLEYEPELEAALLLELAQKNAGLMDILGEHAATHDEDLEISALAIIGAGERRSEWGKERAEFLDGLEGP